MLEIGLVVLEMESLRPRQRRTNFDQKAHVSLLNHYFMEYYVFMLTKKSIIRLEVRQVRPAVEEEHIIKHSF